MRLNRFLSVSGVTSRRKGEVYIRAGRVMVNGEVVTDPALDIVPEKDRVLLDGRPLEVSGEKRYYLLNKPVGVVVSVGDTHGRKTVLDLLGNGVGRVFPVGRLDADTSGALLLTDDGDLAYRLTHPSFGVDKVYRAVVRGKVTGDDVRRIAEGIMLDDGPTAPALMTVLKKSDTVSTVELTLHQGRKRQVRRMLDSLGHRVFALERISFGGLATEGLSPGEYRSLTFKEVEYLQQVIKVNPKSTGTKS